MWMALIGLFVPAGGQCLQVDYDIQGRVKTLFTLRDDDGLKNSAYDDMRGAGWRNELQFDVTGNLAYEGEPIVKIEKFCLSYRGAYDAIFDLRDHRYENIQSHQSDDYEPGCRDIETENDLREVFIDFTGDFGETRAVLRLGRQIVRWGEAAFFNMMNVVCPMDVSRASPFAMPEDLETPLYMARLNYSILDVGLLYSLDVELLAVPDIRPMLQPPLNAEGGGVNFDAPYAFTFSDFSAFPGMTGIREDVPGTGWDNMEYGGKLTAQVGYFQGSIHYVAHFQDAPAADFSEYWNASFSGSAGPVSLRHPRQRTYGFTFNNYIPQIDIITRGEAVCTDKEWINDKTDFIAVSPAFGGKGFSWIAEHKSYQYLLGIDKDWKHLPIGTLSGLSTAIEFYWKHFSSLEDDYSDIGVFGNRRDQQLITFDIRTDYWSGRIKPGISLQYDPEGIWWSLVGVKYQKARTWWCSVNQMTFWGNESASNKWAAYNMLTKTDIFFEFGIQF
jgi:hypothetical protein